MTWSSPSPSFPHLPQPNPHDLHLPNIRQISLGLHEIGAVTIILFFIVVILCYLRHQKSKRQLYMASPGTPRTNHLIMQGPHMFTYKEFSKATKNFSKSEILGSGRFRCGLQSALVPGLARFVIEIWCSCKDGAAQKGLNRCLFTTIYQTKALTNGSSMKVKNNNLKCDVM